MFGQTGGIRGWCVVAVAVVLGIGGGQAQASSGFLAGGDAFWLVSDDLVAQPTSGSCSFGAPGSGAGVWDASRADQQDAFDFGALAWVDGTQVGGAITSTSSEATFAPVSISGLTVQMRLRALSSQPTLRASIVLSNPTASAISVPVEYASNFGSDEATSIQATSSGDTTFAVTDRWLITDDSTTSEDPVNTTVVAGPGSPRESADAVATSLFQCSMDQGAYVRFDSVGVPAGATRTLMTFQQLSVTTADAASSVVQFDTTPTLESPLTEGLTADELASVVNWEAGPQNTPPVAADDSYTHYGTDTALTVTAAGGLLADDTDADDDPLTAVKVSDPSHGTLTAFEPDGSFTYQPDEDFVGSDSFTYGANDGTDDSNTATVTIAVGAGCRGQQATVVGTKSRDKLPGTSGPDVIAGLGGDDSLLAGEGDDVVCGGGGDDSINASSGDDHGDGGSGADVLRGDVGADELLGGLGDDLLLGAEGDDSLSGGAGAGDTCKGDVGTDSGDDTCEHSSGIP